MVRHRNIWPSPLWVRIPPGTFIPFIWGSYPARLRKVDGQGDTGGLLPPVKLESRHINFAVLVRRKTQVEIKKRRKRWSLNIGSQQNEYIVDD